MALINLIQTHTPMIRDFRDRHDGNANDEWEMPIIKNTDQAATHLKHIWDENLFFVQEEIYLIFLNNKNELIWSGRMASGGTDTCTFDLKVFMWFLARFPMTKRVIVSHNHPGKNATPTDKDIHCTTKLKTILGVMDVKLVDHIIFSPSGYFSFLQVGMLEDKD